MQFQSKAELKNLPGDVLNDEQAVEYLSFLDTQWLQTDFHSLGTTYK